MYRGRGVADYQLLRAQAALFPESEVRILFPAAHRPTAVPGHRTARGEARVAGLNPAQLADRFGVAHALEAPFMAKPSGSLPPQRVLKASSKYGIIRRLE